MNSSFHGNDASNGGVIWIMDSVELHISNSNFRRNRASLLGGVIFSEGKSALYVVNSTFESNHAYIGGAVFVWKNRMANITESIFKSNGAKAGGALVAMENGHLYLYKSQFERNSAMTLGGAVFSVASTIRIQHCVFAANAASNGAGLFAISNVPAELNYIFIRTIMQHHNGTNGTVVINDSKFVSNIAHFGGAMSFLGNMKSLVYNTLFHENTAVQQSGTIRFAHQVESNIVDCNFTFNNAYDGGGIFMNEHVDSIINNGKFISNRALSSGGVIYGKNIKNLKVKSSRFDGNHAKAGTSLLLVGSFKLDVTDCTFTYNVATNYNNNNDDYNKSVHENVLKKLLNSGDTLLLGHTLVLDNIASSTINSSQFISNKGGAINLERGELSLISCEFTNNSAFLGGAVHTVLNSMVTVKNSSFVRNNANIGGALFGLKSTVVVFSNSFTENTAFSGGAVHIQQAEVRIVDTNFTENKARGIGGAVTITLDAPFTIRDSTFNSNTANKEAGAIIVYNTLNMDFNQNPIFSDLNQEIPVGFVKELFPVMRSKKLNTRATGYLFNNKFYDNTGKTSSAFFGGTTVEISHCDFIANGKIMLVAVPHFSITYSLFENNIDGAVMAANCSMPLVITNSQFINNTRPFDKKGSGAVTAANCSVVISNSTFARNSRYFGAAVGMITNFHANTLHITNSSFQSNNAIAGGAIYVLSLADNNKIHLKDSKFIQNTAVVGASVLLFGNITVDFSYCSFYGNSAPKGSGIVGHGNITIKVSDSSFINNAGIIKGQTAQQIVMDSTPLKTWKTEQGSPLEAPIVTTFLEELEELSKNKEKCGFSLIYK